MWNIERSFLQLKGQTGGKPHVHILPCTYLCPHTERSYWHMDRYVFLLVANHSVWCLGWGLYNYFWSRTIAILFPFHTSLQLYDFSMCPPWRIESCGHGSRVLRKQVYSALPLWAWLTHLNMARGAQWTETSPGTRGWCSHYLGEASPSTLHVDRKWRYLWVSQ